MINAKFIKVAETTPGAADCEYDASCGHCDKDLGRRASFPASRGTDHITCSHCGVTNAVRKPRVVA